MFTVHISDGFLSQRSVRKRDVSDSTCLPVTIENYLYVIESNLDGRNESSEFNDDTQSTCTIMYVDQGQEGMEGRSEERRVGKRERGKERERGSREKGERERKYGRGEGEES